MWAFLRTIRANPVYQRESGRWGEPNSFYSKLNRFSPFVIMGALVLGLCGGNNLFSLAGLDSGTEWLLLFVCLPNVVMQMLTWAALFLVPALTAPAVAEEIKRGTWEILRLTPQPTHHVLFAKLFGALSRLKIWWPLFIVSILQAIATAVGIVAASSTYEIVSFVAAVFLGTTLLLRPWFEIGYAAIVGLTVSTWASSSRAALTACYSIIFGTKIVVWFGSLIAGILLDGYWASTGETFFLGASIAPLVVYFFANVTCAAVLYRRSLSVDTWSA